MEQLFTPISGYTISNKSHDGVFLRESLAPGEGSVLNWNMATGTWQTYDRAFATKKAHEGFTVTAK